MTNAAAGEREPERATAGRAAREHDEQEREREVRLVELRAHEQQHRGRGETPNQTSQSPRRAAFIAPSLVMSKRYPTAGSVRISLGRTGSASSLRRS